jgi:hypothetical protein
MRSFASNRAYVLACLAEMPDYERAQAIFWTLSSDPPAGSPPYLQMTLGNIILALDELRALADGLNPNERSELEHLRSQWEAIREKATGQLLNTALREASSRTGQWRTYVAESVEAADLSDYAANVRPRLCALRLLEWLGADHPGVRGAFQELAAIDTQLTPHMEEGPFLLDPRLAAVYPPAASHKFLYRRPRSSGT